MLTCFIKNEFTAVEQKVTIAFFLLIPLFFFIYAIYKSIIMCFTKKIRKDKMYSNLFYKYMSYISIYLIFNLPMIILYMITMNTTIKPDTFYSWWSFVNIIFLFIV